LEAGVRSVGIYEAKTQPSKLVDAAASGETITITKHGAPVAQLTPVQTWSGRARSYEEVQASIAAWRAYRKTHNIALGSELTIMDLIREGRPR
jgi:prevent-host-death family protein